ncbi:SigE family RNA polymerase sigma factor [Catellatospora vulcania]|uniref:SigE family RNA polymerase sigma factor n=1 Tax=Catellatospora vulcania TaxID=1460450 RepID=UPI0012D48901|nr:SigE family RNA polymerase sigma factor [Catellatospora vulcania]
MSVPPPPRPAALSAPASRAAARRALDATDFDAFYQANYAGTVAVAFGLTGDREQAQDLAQEAYCRAWQRWAEISRYDNPPAWVYRVTVNLARSRWRNLRVAAAHLVRQRPADVPAAGPEHVALVTALRALPMDQRQAIVLHHLVDLPVSEVAREMGVPAGTVKSWLHRGRTELAALLGEHAHGDGGRVAPQDVRRRGDRRRQLRRGGLAAATAAICALVAVFALQAVRADRTPPPPAQSPSPSPAALPSAPPPSPAPIAVISADDPIRGVDWRGAVITVPPAPGCPAGRLTFRTATDEGSPWVTSGSGFPQLRFDPVDVTHVDLTGDGRAEAVLRTGCMSDNETSGDGGSQLLVVTREADGTLRGLGWAGERGAFYPAVWAGDQVVYLEMQPWHGGPQDYRIGMVYGYGWNGRAIVPVDVSAAYPPVAPTVEGRRLDLTGLADELACAGLPAPAGPVRPVFDADGVAEDGDREWALVPGAPSNGPHLARLDPDRRPYLVLLLACAADGALDSTNLRVGHNLVVFDLAPDGWFAVARVPTPAERTIGSWYLAPGGLMVGTFPAGGGEGGDVMYRWNGTSFAE